MSEIFVQSFKSANSRSTNDANEDHAASQNLHWCHLVDQTLHDSKGLSMGHLKIPVGHSLAPHRHAQQEIYYILKGRAQLLCVGETEKNLNPGDTVYIPQNALHGLKNIGNALFELLWIFPKDSWSEIDYSYQ